MTALSSAPVQSALPACLPNAQATGLLSVKPEPLDNIPKIPLAGMAMSNALVKVTARAFVLTCMSDFFPLWRHLPAFFEKGCPQIEFGGIYRCDARTG